MLLHFEIFLVLLLALGYLVSLRHPLITIAAFYVFLNGLVNSFYPFILNGHVAKNLEKNYPVGTITDAMFSAKLTEGLEVLSKTSLMSTLFCVVMFCLIFSIRRMSNLWTPLLYLTLINSIVMIVMKYTNGLAYGVMLNSTMDATFLAIMYPALWLFTRHDEPNEINIIYWIARIIPIVAIFVSTSSIGIGGLCLGMAIVGSKQRKAEMLALMIGSIVIFGVALWSNPLLLSDSLRFVCWVWSMEWWQSNANMIFGTGLGSYHSLGPYLQQATHQNLSNGLYNMLHNDWLQCLFELGFVGLGLMVALFVSCIRRVYRNEYVLAQVVVFGATSFINMPARYPITVIVGLLLLRLSMESNNWTSSDGSRETK